ncbi:histidine kinase [Actinocorallia aurea]
MRARVVDGVTAVCVAGVLLFAGVSEAGSAKPAAYVGCFLLAAGGLSLALRRRAPVQVLVFTAVCAAGCQAAGFQVPAIAYLFAVYAAMRAGHRVATAVVSLGLLAALPLASLAVADGGSVFEQSRAVLELAWLVAAAAAGEALRQAERRADEAERTREETARRRADEERLRIARELHDSLTHQISVVKVQAEAAVRAAHKRGEPVPEALLAIRQAGGEAARELRATLSALRDDGTVPPKGLDHVPELVEGARSIGLDATLTVEGVRPDVPAALGRTVYRIVQESLTNTARHARASTATVRIAGGPAALSVRVDDDGRAPAKSASPPGIGLLGMRERVGALGGRLHAGPREEGGFTVHAEFPLDPAS